MDEDNKAVETTSEPAVPQQVPGEDYEAKVASLEAEKARLIEENANWKVAALKYKHPERNTGEETDEERMRRIALETVAESRLVEIAREQDDLIKKALKENKELKLAQLNKTNVAPPAAAGGHTETIEVKDTTITPDQIAAFKARNWTDKDIERYKKNLQRYSGR